MKSGFALIVAVYLGSLTTSFLFLFGVDYTFVTTKKSDSAVVDKDAFDHIAKENCQLKIDLSTVRCEVVDWKSAAHQFAGELSAARADKVDACTRGNRLAAQLANVEQQLTTAKTLLDASRRDNTRIPVIVEDEAERIPPQNLPVPFALPQPPTAQPRKE